MGFNSGLKGLMYHLRMNALWYLQHTHTHTHTHIHMLHTHTHTHKHVCTYIHIYISLILKCVTKTTKCGRRQINTKKYIYIQNFYNVKILQTFYKTVLWIIFIPSSEKHRTYLLMYSGVWLIQQSVIVEPCKCRFWECNIWNMDREIFSSTHCDVTNTSKVHAWLIRLFFNQNVVTWSTGIWRAYIIHSYHSELVLITFLQIRHLSIQGIWSYMCQVTGCEYKKHSHKEQTLNLNLNTILTNIIWVMTSK